MSKIGGKKYGEGSFGVTYDACEEYDSETFCKLPALQAVKHITLYGIRNQKTITSVENFRKHINGLQGYVVKVFKNSLTRNTEKSFLEEIVGLRPIYKVLSSSQLDKYTALPHTSILRYEGTPYLAISTDNGIYATFARSCTTDLNHTEFTDDTLKKLITHIVPALTVLRKHGFSHSDIKPENIMYSAREKRFKLIDWGLSRYLTTPANLYTPNEFGCPLGHYISGQHSLIALGRFYQTNLFAYTAWSQSAIFIDLLQHIAKQVLSITDSNQTVDDLFHKYAGCFDTFSFGLVIAYIVWKNGLDWSQHRDTCLRLITLPI
jgi:serine/threonine protein kinase